MQAFLTTSEITAKTAQTQARQRSAPMSRSIKGILTVAGPVPPPGRGPSTLVESPRLYGDTRFLCNKYTLMKKR